jgi:hypothetical protein
MLTPTPSDRNAFCYSAQPLDAEYCVAMAAVQQPREVIRRLDAAITPICGAASGRAPPRYTVTRLSNPP